MLYKNNSTESLPISLQSYLLFGKYRTMTFTFKENEKESIYFSLAYSQIVTTPRFDDARTCPPFIAWSLYYLCSFTHAHCVRTSETCLFLNLCSKSVFSSFCSKYENYNSGHQKQKDECNFWKNSSYYRFVCDVFSHTIM